MLKTVSAYALFLFQLIAMIPSGAYSCDVSTRCSARSSALYETYREKCFDEDAQRLWLYSDQPDTTATCWEYCGRLSLAYKSAVLTGSFSDCDAASRALQYYRHVDSDGAFAGYAVARADTKGKADDGIAYDDNMWLCKTFIALYELCGEQQYLDYAVEIGDYLLSDAYTELDEEIFRSYGFDIPPDTQLGGFYWDVRHDALHACSNGPAADCLASLYRITKNAKYLDAAKKTYNYLLTLVTPDGVFYDLTAFEKDDENNITGIMGLSEDIYSYNSGSPVKAAVELYRATADGKYLDSARLWAEKADAYFAKDRRFSRVKSYPGDNVWFNLILLDGFVALAPYDDDCGVYIENMLHSIDLAYRRYRQSLGIFSVGGFLPADWTNGFGVSSMSDYNSLSISANAEIYATLAIFYGASFKS